MNFVTLLAVLAGIAITYGVGNLAIEMHRGYKGKPPKRARSSEEDVRLALEKGQQEGFVAGYQLAIKVLENDYEPGYEKAVDRLRGVEDEVDAGWKSWGS